MERIWDDYAAKNRVRIDYNNMLADYAGQHGIMREELDQSEARAESASERVNSNRALMPWRDLPHTPIEIIEDIEATAKSIRERFDNFVVLGIGGSALGTIALSNALNHLHYNLLDEKKRNAPRLFVEDNIDPERMAALFDCIDLERTMFNVITKSGSTSETMSQLLIVAGLIGDKLGKRLSEHIIATTDKKNGSLIKIANEHNLKTFIIPDGVGGRFSVLCPVGLLPAAVCGINIRKLLLGAEYMDSLCLSTSLKANPALMLATLEVIAMENHGANIGVLMPYADSLKLIADWYAQLWAESLGKKKQLADGSCIRMGQTPVKSLGVTDQHSQIQLYTDGPFDKTITLISVERHRASVKIPQAFWDIPKLGFLCGHTLNELMHAELQATEHALTVSGHMNKTIILPCVNEFTIGQLIMLFELQTAYAAELIGVNAFDQPGVEEGKNATYALLGNKDYSSKLSELRNTQKKDFANVI